MYSILKQNTQKQLKKIQQNLEDFLVLDKDFPSNAKFTFVDFASGKSVPNLGTTFKRFHEIVDYANEWLTKHGEWEVVGCETIRSTLKVLYDKNFRMLERHLIGNSENVTAFNFMVPLSTGSSCYFPLVLFRMWIKLKDDIAQSKDKSRITQKIKYMDFVPEKNGDEFEMFDQLVDKINKEIKEEQIKGRIINVQTFPCLADKEWAIDPESTEPIVSDNVLNIIRVFYEVGPPCEDEIGLADFIPKHISGGSIFSRPKFESQDVLFERVSQWLSSNPEINFLNAQTIEMKLKSMTSMNSRLTATSRTSGDYIRILRIAYQKPAEIPEDIPQSSFQPPPPPVYLKHNVFSLNNSVKSVKQEINDFFSRDEWRAEERFKWRFFNAESFNVMASKNVDVGSYAKSLNESFHYNRICNQIETTSGMAMNTTTLYMFRLYFDVGFYGKDEMETVEELSRKAKDNQKSKVGCVSQ